MKNYTEEYLEYLSIQKKYSQHTITKYQMIYQEYQKFLQEINQEILKVQTNDLKNFIYQLHDRGYKSATIANYISAMKSLYKYFLEQDYIIENVTERIKYPKKESKLYEIIYQKELQDFFNAINQEEKYKLRNKALFSLLYASGIRVSECANLKTIDVNFSTNMINVYGKGKKERFVPVAEEILQVVDVYIKTERETMNQKYELEYLFLNKHGKQLTDRGIRYLTTKFCKKAALYTNLSPHKFRHTLATNLLNNGMDLRLIQEILGHETLATTQKYTHISSRQLQDMYDTAIDRK